MNPDQNIQVEQYEAEYRPILYKMLLKNVVSDPAQAMIKIQAAETKFAFTFTQNPHLLERSDSGNLRKRLLVFVDLGIAEPAEEAQLETLNSEHSDCVRVVMSHEGISEQEAEEAIEDLFRAKSAETFSEAKELFLGAPAFSGFENTLDVKMKNEFVQQFVFKAFSPEVIKKIKLLRVSKDDKYLIYTGSGKNKLAKPLLEQGVIFRAPEQTYGLYYAPSRESYILAAKALEGVEESSLLSHVHKVRSEEGSRGQYAEIRLRSFGIEEPSNYDYLESLKLSEENKKRAFILGTLAHEIAHRVHSMILKDALFQGYSSIIEAEKPEGLGREELVSNYALSHKRVFNTPVDNQIREDFAESVRIYLTNPEFLKQNYPRRFEFIQTYCPFIKAGAIVEELSK